jgi:hypothetical protein
MSELQHNYASFLVDSHITDHDDSFLSRLDPEQFVQMVKQTGADSVMVYACCHNGNCYYPTRVGRMHRNLKGRDFFGETIRLLRKEGIAPRAYYTVVYMRRAARENPSWRVCQIDGAQSYRRSWYCCPNSAEYRAFAKAHIQEISAYDIASIFIDMTFWPGICFCHNCRARFLSECRREIPQVIDWNDPNWVQFQRSRERWLSEFAHEMTAAAKSAKRDIAVAHQFAPILLGWMYGQSHALSLANDVPSGDFYGGKHQQRFGTKVLAAFAKELPFEFMTSRCVTLYDHTSTKSDDELVRSCATTLANGGTYLLIDAINPDGTLEPHFYQRMKRLAEQIRPFKQRLAQLRPRLQADTGLYFSTHSHRRRDHNGVSLREVMNPINNMLAASDLKALQEVLGTSIVLNRAKTPYRVLTDQTTDLAGLKTIIANDVSFMSAAEVERLRRFVHDGSTLIATGMTSQHDLDGQTSGDFALKDVFGVTFTGQFSKHWNYLATEAGERVSNDVPAPLVNATTASVLARAAEPMFDRDDLEHFASYHSNPPDKPGPHAALTVNKFGRGTCVYLYSSLLAKQQEAQQAFGESLLRRFAPSSIIAATNAPPCVEITLLRAAREPVYLLCFVNFQEEAPNVPVHEISVSVRLPCGGRPKACRSVATGRAVSFERRDEHVAISVPRVDMMEMIEIEVEQAAWLRS